MLNLFTDVSVPDGQLRHTSGSRAGIGEEHMNIRTANIHVL